MTAERGLPCRIEVGIGRGSGHWNTTVAAD
jgi:hypothetical protein